MSAPPHNNSSSTTAQTSAGPSVHFIEQGNAGAHGRFAYVLARALVERADIEIIALCRVEVGPSVEGALARLTLAWAQGDLDTAVTLLHEIGDEIDPDHELWAYFNWAAIPVYVYQGDTDKVVEAAAIAAADERGYASLRAQAVALWALGLLYRGRRDEAAALMEDKEHILQLSPCSGFVAYTRAEIVAANDSRTRHRLPRNSFTMKPWLRMPRSANASPTGLDSRCFVHGGHAHQATRLALRLVPELTQAGTYPQAWRAMRNIADLLGQLDAPETALLVLDSANAATSAPAVTGAALKVKEHLRAQVGEIDAERAPMALGPLWEQVEQVLRNR